jgi:hypothetical protein
LLRGHIDLQSRYCALQRHLLARQFADIPTALPIQNITTADRAALIVFSILPASLALDACHLTSPLVTQRFSPDSALTWGSA